MNIVGVLHAYKMPP